MRRWCEKEERALVCIRERLKDELATIEQHPDTIGERKLIRFLRGHNYDMDVVCDMISKYINWRKVNNVDKIRDDIVRGGRNHPSRFPKGETILNLIPGIVVDHNIRDEFGCPIVFEQYNFSPSEVLTQISLEDYVIFTIYSMEYRSLIVEQLSEEEERRKVKALMEKRDAGEDLSATEPYGTLHRICIIRDLSGVGFEHLGSQGQEIIKTILGVSTPNYPELMRKCHLINAPWLFNTVWWIIKGWLAQRTIEKVGVFGDSFLEHLQEEITMKNLPSQVGGEYSKPSEPFPFDVTQGGPLHTPSLIPGK